MKILGVNWRIWVADLILVLSRVLGNLLPKLNFKVFGFEVKLGTLLATLLGFPGKYLLWPALIFTGVLVLLHYFMRHKSKIKRLLSKIKLPRKVTSVGRTVGRVVREHVISYPEPPQNADPDEIREIVGFKTQEKL